VASNQKDDLLRKIAGLMAKAESTEHEGERDVFMQKADELMAKYSIELWELSQREQGKVSERQPVIRDYDYSWAFPTGAFPEICDALWSLFISSSRHANCTIVYHKQHYSHSSSSYRSGTVPVIGTEVDLGYMSLLFTSLMTQLVDATHPRVDKNLSYEENLKTFREAGWGWLEVAKVMQDAGYDLGMSISDARHKEAHAYRRACKKFGWTQDYANFKTYRRNFAEGFASRVGYRLQEMRATTAAHVGTGMELALRDQSKINLDFMNEMFPPTGQRRSKAVANYRKHDSAAYGSGHRAGDKAKIAGRNDSLSGNKKSLGK